MDFNMKELLELTDEIILKKIFEDKSSYTLKKYNIKWILENIESNFIKLESKNVIFNKNIILALSFILLKKIPMKFKIFGYFDNGNLIINNNQEIIAMIYMYCNNLFKEKINLYNIKEELKNNFSEYIYNTENYNINFGMLDKKSNLEEYEKKRILDTEIEILISYNKNNVLKDINNMFLERKDYEKIYPRKIHIQI